MDKRKLAIIKNGLFLLWLKKCNPFLNSSTFIKNSSGITLRLQNS